VLLVLVIDSVFLHSRNVEVAFLAVGLTVAGVVVAGTGLAMVAAAPYPFSLASAIINGPLGVFAFSGFAASLDHRSRG
jgi:hypothetical protein